MKNLLVCGMGLLGGSLAKKLSTRKDLYNLRVWSRSASSSEAARAWGLDSCGDLNRCLQTSEIVLLAMPIPATVEFLKTHSGDFAPGCVVTDIGSLKKPVMKAAMECLRAEKSRHSREWYFVGSHPMAGTEKTGFADSFAELYDNCDVFVTPPPECPRKALDSVTELWQAVGGTPRRIDPMAHDALVARTSHLLHVLASALALSILSGRGDADKLLHFAGCATGFRDTSRIASSSPRMWREIVEGNREEVLQAMEEFSARVEEYRQAIEKGDFDRFEELFAEGKCLRDEWLNYKKEGLRA